MPPLFVPFSGFDYPLNGFLLPKPLAHFSEPSTHGICPFRVFLRPKVRTSFESDALMLSINRSCQLKTLRGLLTQLQSFSPFGKPYSPKAWIRHFREPLLSWAFSPLRLTPFDPWKPFQAPSSLVLLLPNSEYHRTVDT